MEHEFIEIVGARANNLKNLIPKKKITIFTGVSGSGKSSIVFETIAQGTPGDLRNCKGSITAKYL